MNDAKWIGTTECGASAPSRRYEIIASFRNLACILVPCLLCCITTYALAPPYSNFHEWESVHTMRRRLNVTYNYEPVHLSHDHCRFLSEDDCRAEDEGLGHAKLGINGRRLSPSISQNFRILVILVRFSDHATRVLPTREYVEELFNGSSPSAVNPVGSVKEYLRYSSLGKYRVTFDVRDWHTAPNTEAFYSQGKSGLLGTVAIQQMFYAAMDAAQAAGVDWLNGYIDDWGLINHLVVIHSGYPAEAGPLNCISSQPQNRIWSQGCASSPEGWMSPDFYQVNGYAIGSAFQYVSCDTSNNLKATTFGLGVIQHEYLHGFGLKDLYDLDKDDVRIPLGGVGRFDIMSNGLGWDRNVSIAGHMSVFSRMKVPGWLDPILITQDGFYAIQPSEISGQVYQIKHNFPEGEYLLIENRQRIKWDSNWPATGIVIYHVDEKKSAQSTRGYPGKAGWPADHYMVSVLQADGKYDIEKGVNLGDAGDFWVKDMILGPGPNTWPNTDSIQGGTQKATGIKITVRSNSGFIMTFRVEGIDSTQRNGENPSFGRESQPPPDTTGSVLSWLISLLGGIAALIGVLVIVL